MLSRIAYFAVLFALIVGMGIGEDAPQPRLANGAPIEGALLEATADGLKMQSPKGERTYHWKYLSAGTRFRYEKGNTAETTPDRTNEAAKADSAASTNASQSNAGSAVPAGKSPAVTNSPAKSAAAPKTRAGTSPAKK